MNKTQFCGGALTKRLLILSLMTLVTVMISAWALVLHRTDIILQYEPLVSIDSLLLFAFYLLFTVGYTFVFVYRHIKNNSYDVPILNMILYGICVVTIILFAWPLG